INSYFEKIKIALQQENFAKKDLSVKLTKLKERVLLYASNLELLKQKEKIIAEHTQKADELSPTIETNKKELQDLNENLSTIKEEIKKLNSTKSTFEEVEKEVKDIKAKKTEFEKNRKLLESLNKSNKEISEYLKKNERLRDQHKLANDAITTKKKLLTQMEQKKDFQKQWEDILKINQQLFEKIMPELEKRKNACLKSKSLVDKEVSDLDKIYLIKNKRLESLNVASGAIQDAVARIRKHLSADQRDCPVCQSTYEPEVLINRIEKSLNALNPEIPIAIADEKEALEVLGTAKEKLKKENQEISKIESELKIEQDKLDTNKNKITEVFLPQFLDCKTSEDAQKYIKDNIKEISTQINELTDNKNKFDSEVTSDALSEAKLKKSEFERLIKELSTKTETAKNEIDNETEKINNLTKVLSDKNKEKVLADIVSKSTDQKQKTESIQKLEVVINKNEIQFKEYQKVLISEKESISKIKGNQEGICAEWRQVKLESQPSVETLKTKQEIVLKNIDELERANIPLNSVEQELANWRAAEKYSEADKEVKKQIGDFSEDDYLKGLKSSIDKNKKRLDSVQKKKMTVEAFLDNAKEESEKITEQLNAINTPWKGLLKRIVINPLISEAPLLNSTISRNSQKASTFANLHEENFSMDKIASEAQLTDLQLTFMLAMANKYQWTPWKALLLDDPTQHHDLVHASSVFDVLRDYIIDLDYQVLMSTHDSVQAKFFQRKLENEGVLSKIYQLVARKGGVTAERMM
ncbi:MAG: hypothetical protein KAJ18_05640, partial [Candidatus Omnitrophica bacterium]|nr:hypothetical protein [Candidatus Omnitrophota bacterium]